MASSTVKSTNLHLTMDSAPREVESFFEQFEIWADLQGTLSEQARAGHLCGHVSMEVFSLVRDILMPKQVRAATYQEIKSAILSYFSPVKSHTAERAAFHQMIRTNSEKVRNFAIRLQHQASSCQFGGQLFVSLKDQFIAGINDATLKRKMILKPDKSYIQLKEFAEQYESAISICQEKSATLYQSSSRKVSHQKRIFLPKKKLDENRKQKCYRCGNSHSNEECRFKNAQCFKCKRTGHTQRMCKAVHKSYKTEEHSAHESESSTLYTGTSVQACTSSYPKTAKLSVEKTKIRFLRQLESKVYITTDSWYLEETMKSASGHLMDFVLDTGSTRSIISQKDLAKFYPTAKISPTRYTIKGVTGDHLKLIGECQVPIKWKGKHEFCTFLVAKESSALLGLQTMRQLKMQLTLETEDSHINDNIVTSELIHKCSQNTGGMKIESAKLEVSGEPIFAKRRIIAYGLRDAVKIQLDKLQHEGIIQKVESSSWATAIVTPLKSDGVTPRICGDYRTTLNKYLLQRSCTTEEPEDILNRLKGAKLFSQIDLQNAYLQIPLDEESKKLTTINTPYGLYTYNYLPFGLSVSPAIFQDTMDKVLHNLKGVVAYQDDVIVHGRTKQIHDENLRAVLVCFKKYNVRIKA